MNENFIYGVLSGFICAIILSFMRKIWRLIYSKFISSRPWRILSKSKILYIFDDMEKAKEELYQDMRNSKKVYIYSSIEYSVTVESTKINQLLKSKEGDIKFLLMKPNSTYHEKRAEEVKGNLQSSTVGGYIDIVDRMSQKNSSIKWTVHDEFLRHKYYILDDVMYLGFRLKGSFSDNEQIYKIGKESRLYKSFCLQFSDSWENSTGEKIEV